MCITGIHIVIIYEKISSMDEEQAVFEQLYLSDFKIWSSTGLKTVNNYSIMMTNISNKMRISSAWCCDVITPRSPDRLKTYLH